MTSIPTPNDEVTWCCPHAEHGKGAPPIYSMAWNPGMSPRGFGCLHLTIGDRLALVSGTVPEHLQPEYGPMTAWGLSGRFRALSEGLVEFMGRGHPRLPQVLESLQNAEGDALGFAGPYPVIDEEDQSGDESAAAEAGFVNE